MRREFSEIPLHPHFQDDLNDDTCGVRTSVALSRTIIARRRSPFSISTLTRERLRRRRRRRRSSFLLPSFAPHSIPFESLSTTVAIGGSSGGGGGAFPFSSSPTLPGCAAPSFFLPYCHCQDDSDHLSQQAALLLLPSPLLPRRRRRRRRRRRPRLPRPPSPACCWRFRFFYLCWSVRPSDDGSLLPGRVHTAHRRRQRSRQADEQPATPLCLSLLLRRSNPHSATD